MTAWLSPRRTTSTARSVATTIRSSTPSATTTGPSGRTRQLRLSGATTPAVDRAQIVKMFGEPDPGGSDETCLQIFHGHGVATSFKKRCEELKIKVLGHESINPLGRDFAKLMEKIKDKAPDLVYLGGTTQTGGPAIARKVAADDRSSIASQLRQVTYWIIAAQLGMYGFGCVPADSLGDKVRHVYGDGQRGDADGSAERHRPAAGD